MLYVIPNQVSDSLSKSLEFISSNDLGILLNDNNVIINHNDKVDLFLSDFGNCTIEKLPYEIENAYSVINRAVDCGCTKVAFYCGKKPDKLLSNKTIDACVDKWLCKISDFTIQKNIIPLIRFNVTSYVNDIIVLVKLLNKFRRWNIYYSPNDLIRNKLTDVFKSYWTLLSARISYVNVLDFKTGKGPVVPGSGNIGFHETIMNCSSQNFCVDANNLFNTRFSVFQDYILKVKNQLESHYDSFERNY